MNLARFLLGIFAHAGKIQQDEFEAMTLEAETDLAELQTKYPLLKYADKYYVKIILAVLLPIARTQVTTLIERWTKPAIHEMSTAELLQMALDAELRKNNILPDTQN